MNKPNHNAKVTDLQVGDIWRWNRQSEFTGRVTELNPFDRLIAVDSLAFPNDGQRYEDLFDIDTDIFIVAKATV